MEVCCVTAADNSFFGGNCYVAYHHFDIVESGLTIIQAACVATEDELQMVELLVAKQFRLGNV